MEAGTSSPINEITLLYEMNKEQQRKNSLKNNSKNNVNNNNDANLSDIDGYLTEEEKIYRRKSVLSDSSVDNISNVNLNLTPTLNNMDEEIIKKDKFLTPHYGQISKMYKHNSLNSLSSNRSYSSDSYSNTNIPTLLSIHKSRSNQFSLGTGSLPSNNNISIGNSISKSESNSIRGAIRGKSTSSNSSSRSNTNLNATILIEGLRPSLPGRSLSTPPPFEPVKDSLKDTSSSNIGNERNSLQASSSNNNNGNINQFKTNSPEKLTVDSIHDTDKNRLTDSPTDITEIDEKELTKL